MHWSPRSIALPSPSDQSTVGLPVCMVTVAAAHIRQVIVFMSRGTSVTCLVPVLDSRGVSEGD